jgi:TPR repeat protein
MAHLPAESAGAFVSYARKDFEFTNQLVCDLRKHGVRVWLDRTNIPLGSDWTSSVQAALHGCHQFLIVLSPASVRSQTVLAELNFALDQGKPVVPVLYQECPRPFRINSTQYADFTKDYRNGLSELLARLGAGQRDSNESHAQLPDNEAFWTSYVAIMREKYFAGPLPSYSKLGFHDLLQAAEREDVGAMTELAVRFLNGSGGVGEKSPKAAQQWLERACQSGSADAAYELGMLFYTGAPGLAADQRTAMEWFRKADALGSASAAYLLGKNYQNGDDGFPKDPAKAAVFFEHAADRGAPEAMNELAIAYQHGLGVPKDESRAVDLYRRSVDGNYAVAMDNLGVLYRDGLAGLPKDEKKAVELFQRGAELDEGWCLYDLGVAYTKGMGGLPLDEAAAGKKIQRAAQLNIPDALYAMGMFYELGRGGMPRDLLNALRFYKRGAALNNTLAAQRLALLAPSEDSSE